MQHTAKRAKRAARAAAVGAALLIIAADAALGSASPHGSVPAAGGVSVETIEADYADWLDAGSALSTIDSGLTRRVAGRGRRAWSAQLRELAPALERSLASADPANLSSEDARALQAMRKGFADNAPESPPGEGPAPRIVCGDGAQRDGDAAAQIGRAHV